MYFISLHLGTGTHSKSLICLLLRRSLLHYSCLIFLSISYPYLNVISNASNCVVHTMYIPK
jgi:hypothetical protein